MDCTFSSLSYSKAGYFTPIVLDYLNHPEKLSSFFSHPVTKEGLLNSIESRKKSIFQYRELLVEELSRQYEILEPGEKVTANLRLLAAENTFTVCTAHQPAIFTGTLYFVYKILHTIKLCEALKAWFPENNYVPVFYMGSEDADLDELGKIFLEGEKIVWQTNQTGAVGRMNTKGLEAILQRIEGELSILPSGNELISILKDAYQEGSDIQTSTFRLLHNLFKSFGLIVLIPDNRNLKKVMLNVFEDDLLKNIPSSIVQSTAERIEQDYKVQAKPRPINLFYLDGNIRARIEKNGDRWVVVGENTSFSRDELLQELHKHPEKFSPNVILRGIFQEMILPNIAFIGGGGELAYWLEYKDLFEYYHVPLPVLVLRNSFLIIGSKWKEKLDKLGIDDELLFQSERKILKELVSKESSKKLTLAEEIDSAHAYYHQLKTLAGTVDDTLVQHVSALQSRAIRPLQELEKKLMRAELRKFEAEQRQIHAIKVKLFPMESLQERIDNFMPYYAKWGKSFIDELYNHSFTIEQKFGILAEKVSA